MPDLSRSKQNVLRCIIVVGDGLVNVLLLTAFPEICSDALLLVGAWALIGEERVGRKRAEGAVPARFSKKGY
jgi:hypothetical protein